MRIVHNNSHKKPPASTLKISSLNREKKMKKKNIASNVSVILPFSHLFDEFIRSFFAH